MELFLNLIWLAVSAALGALVLVHRSHWDAAPDGCVSRRSTVWVAYLVLIALMLPAISMTDDLLAMAVSTDGEQIARRYECSQGTQQVDLHVTLFHAVQDVSWTPLFCSGIVETESSPRVFHPLLTESLRAIARLPWQGNRPNVSLPPSECRG